MNEVNKLYLTTYTKINSKWNNQNLRTKIIKLLEENTNMNLYDLGLCNGFLDITPKVQETKEKITWNSSKLKTFVLQRTLLRKWKDIQRMAQNNTKSYIW